MLSTHYCIVSIKGFRLSQLTLVKSLGRLKSLVQCNFGIFLLISVGVKIHGVLSNWIHIHILGEH